MRTLLYFPPRVYLSGEMVKQTEKMTLQNTLRLVVESEAVIKKRRRLHRFRRVEV